MEPEKGRAHVLITAPPFIWHGVEQKMHMHAPAMKTAQASTSGWGHFPVLSISLGQNARLSEGMIEELSNMIAVSVVF